MAGIQNQGIIRAASFWRLMKNCSMLLSWLLGAASNLWHFLAGIIPISISMALPFCVSISNLLLLTLFFFVTFFFKFYFIFILYKIVLVLTNIKMNPPQVCMCSPSWTLLPPPSPYHPSGWSQCTSLKHPVSCIEPEPGLATHFIHDILHVSMPFSQIFPPSPSPTESIRLFYTSVSPYS